MFLLTHTHCQLYISTAQVSIVNTELIISALSCIQTDYSSYMDSISANPIFHFFQITESLSSMNPFSILSLSIHSAKFYSIYLLNSSSICPFLSISITTYLKWVNIISNLYFYSSCLIDKLSVMSFSNSFFT